MLLEKMFENPIFSVIWVILSNIEILGIMLIKIKMKI